MESSTIRKRFAEELINIFEKQPSELFLEEESSKSKFLIDTICTFFKFEENISALILLKHIEEVLRKHADEDNLESIPLAIGTLLTTKKENFKNINDPKIKHLFGTCSFNTIQQLVDEAGKLKMELSDDCITHVFKNKMKMQGPFWEDTEMSVKSLKEMKLKPVPVYFHFLKEDFEAEKDELSKDTKFSMTYEENGITGLVGKKFLLKLHEKYQTSLHFDAEEFAESMIQILSTNKSSNELQNELFDMLGFDAFELISALLDDRDKITAKEEVPKQPAGIFNFLTDFLQRDKKKF